MREGDYDPEDLENEASRPDRGAGYGEGTVRPVLLFWTLLWRQRDALHDAGVDPPVDEPFSGRSAKSLAQELATKAAGWIQPVPDEVALPVMAKALWMIGTPAEDVIRLHAFYANSVLNRSTQSKKYIHRPLEKEFRGFSFSCCPGERTPWRPPLGQAYSWNSFNGKWSIVYDDIHSDLRKAVEHVCGACSIVLQSQGGQRINELCGLKATIFENGLPPCVTIRKSKTGLHDLFFLNGLLAKMQSRPIPAEWLIGSRPNGATNVPPTVRALDVLQRLLDPLRKRATTALVRESLIFSFGRTIGYPRDGEGFKPISTQRLLAIQRAFIVNYVDLSALPSTGRHGEDLSKYSQSRGSCIRSHSWRKSFALYVFRVDSRMLPAIAQQFHHLSLAMTEEGYIGNDPTLLDCLDSVRTRETARFFYEMARGKRPAAGRLAKIIDEHYKELETIIAGCDEKSAMKAMESWVLQQDLRIWYANHGKCLLPLAPTRSRCHEAAGTSHWSNRVPNFSMRTPELCVGCPVFAVDGEHADFWIRRYTENMTAWNGAEAKGLTADYRVAEYRALQSAAILQAIGVGLPSLKGEVRLAEE